jgi:uncharacterized iron-regulated membrane protein
VGALAGLTILAHHSSTTGILVELGIVLVLLLACGWIVWRERRRRGASRGRPSAAMRDRS